MSDRLLSSQVDQTMILTISNPDFRNALGPNLYAAGIEALNAAETNPDIRSVIITGEGAHFCGGGNLNRLLENRAQSAAAQEESIDGLHTWMESIRTFPKPVIAAVEGAAARRVVFVFSLGVVGEGGRGVLGGVGEVGRMDDG